MVEIFSLNADNVIGCTIDGKINTKDIEIISNKIDDKLKTHEKVRVYVEVKNLEGISLEAFFKDLNWVLSILKTSTKKQLLPTKHG